MRRGGPRGLRIVVEKELGVVGVGGGGDLPSVAGKRRAAYPVVADRPVDEIAGDVRLRELRAERSERRRRGGSRIVVQDDCRIVDILLVDRIAGGLGIGGGARGE